MNIITYCQEGEKMLLNGLRNLLSLSFMLLLLFAMQVFAEMDAGIEKKQIFPVSKDVNLVPTVKFLYPRSNVIVKMTYPKLESSTNTLNVVNFNDRVMQLLKEQVQSFKEKLAATVPYQKNLPRSANKNELTIDFDSSIVNTHVSPIISVRFSIQGNIGGMAHPFLHHAVINYDLANGQELQLADLFKPEVNYLQILSDYSRNVLSKKLQDPEMVAKGTAPIAENYRIWNINPRGLLITFEEYQVAPYVFGSQKVQIPYSALQHLLAPDSVIANCLKHRKKCFHNHLLTGGFMDEAINSAHRGFDPMLS
jgi:hypothetical protein